MPSPQTSSLTAPALVTLALLTLLLVAERVGLPGTWVQLFLQAMAMLVLLSMLWRSRTTQERVFSGSRPALGVMAGGLVLSAVVTAAITTLVPAVTPDQWLASLLGTLAGLLMAHATMRWGMRRARPEPQGGMLWDVPSMAVIRGLGLILVGSVLALAGLDASRVEILRLLTAGNTLPTGAHHAFAQIQAAFLPPLLALLAVLAGGIRASVLQAAILVIGVFAALGLMLGIGLLYFGPLPLPGQSEATTLAAVAEARERWSVTSPLLLQQWPAWVTTLHGEGLKAFASSALIAAGTALALSPVLPLRRKSMMAVAGAGCIILPLAVIAIAGYAIEAAASTFIGASIARPSAAVVEATRLGLVAICGANPESAEALRLACGISPRDPAQLAWGQVGLTQAYIRTGLSAAIGFSTTVNLSAGIVTAAWHVSMVTVGLGLAAQGLGQFILARSYRAAGLASLRLGLVRLSALLFAVVLAVLPQSWLEATRGWQFIAMAAGAVMTLAFWLWLSARQTQPENAAQTVILKSTRSKASVLSDGKAA